MLEEKNDNPLITDGNQEQSTEIITNDSTQEAVVNDEVAVVDDNVEAVKLEIETPLNEDVEQNILQQEVEEIPIIDYEKLSMEELVLNLEPLVGLEKISESRNSIENIKTAFLSKYNHFLEEKRNEFLAENPDSLDDFRYHFPLKTTFDKLYTEYRDKKNAQQKNIESDLKVNLEKRTAIVEDLKNLMMSSENIKDSLKQFNDLRDRWKNSGNIPKDKYNIVWNNYNLYVSQFYANLDLDREAREIHYKYNLDLKLKIVERAEELAAEQDVNKSFRELQDLHRIWKEDIGPVSKEFSDEIWNKFSASTKIIHDKRDIIFENLKVIEKENLARKVEIIAQINNISDEKMEAHSSWQKQVDKIEMLRTMFFETGKVPNEVNESTWASFKNAVRNFNVTKNSFYKDIKKEQNENLHLKMELVNKAKSLQESEDFETTTPIMKQIQEDWKKIGHVPRKNSDTIWTEFRAACNHYFERIKSQKSEEDDLEIAAFDKKKTYLEELKTFEMSGDHKIDLAAIKIHIENWKAIGRVPVSRRHLDGKFNKHLDGLFEKLSLSKKDSEMMRFNNRMDNLSDSNDTRKIEGEKIFLSKKIEEVKSEINQLENNIMFFANTKNAKKENSIVLEVRKSIATKKEDLEVLKDKLKQIRVLQSQEPNKTE